MFERFNKQLGELEKQLLKKAVIGINKALEQAYQDIHAGAPSNTGRYKQSIKVKKAEIEGNIATGKVYSNLKIGGKNAKWANRCLGILIENGTGPEGASSISTDAVFRGLAYHNGGWWYYWEDKGIFVYTRGMKAKPHFRTGLFKNEKAFIENMKEARKNG